MKRCVAIPIVLLLICAQPLQGGNVLIRDMNRQYGLGRNIVNCVYQDSIGFLWFGMANGLYRFDSNEFTHFAAQGGDRRGFPSADVRAIVEYAQGKLLVGTFDRGLLVFDSRVEGYHPAQGDGPLDLAALSVRSLHADGQGTIWVGTQEGLLQLRPRADQAHGFALVRRFDSSNTQWVSQELVDIMSDDRGTEWFLTMSEIGYIQPAPGRIATFPIYGANSSFAFLDRRRILISCFDTGLRVFDTQTLRFEESPITSLFEGQRIRYAFPDSQSNVWVSVSNVGLVLVRPWAEGAEPIAQVISDAGHQYPELNSNVIYQIGQSREGALWICSEKGINMVHLRDRHFESHSPPPLQPNGPGAVAIRSLLDAGEGHVWVGTLGRGLMQFDLRSQQFRPVPLAHRGRGVGTNIQSMMRDQRGNLWLGTEGEGVIVYRPGGASGHPPQVIQNYRIHPPAPAQGRTLLNNYIMCLLEDSQGNIWIGTWHGLSLIPAAELRRGDPAPASVQTFLADPTDGHSISSNTIMALMEDRQGNIWVGTYRGLNRVVRTERGIAFEHGYRSAHGIPLTEKKILDIHQSAAGVIWFSTQDGGIAHLDPATGVFHEHNASNGFHSHVVNSIAEDASGVLWLGTNNGLCRFDPATLTFQNFGRDEGIPSESFSFQSVSAAGDMLLFGHHQGLVAFHPGRVTPPAIRPNLVFTDFILFNQSAPIGQARSPIDQHISRVRALSLRHNQNNITLDFASLNFLHQEAIQFLCKMGGLDTAWVHLGRNQRITYSYLAPGSYTFKVKAISANPRTPAEIIALDITVYPPWWRTPWAFAGYIALVVLAALLTLHWLVSRVRKAHALALERVNARKTHEVDMMKLQFYTNISHEFRTPLTLLSGPLETLISGAVKPAKAQAYYLLMLKNVNRLKRLIDQLLDLRRIEEGHIAMEWKLGDMIAFVRSAATPFEHYAEKRAIAYRVESSPAQLIAYFDPDKLEKILFNLLSNAFKYTPNHGSVALSLEVGRPRPQPGHTAMPDTLVIRIADSGAGIPPHQLSTIFSPFKQVRPNKPIGSASTGIGLTLAKELVELHQGQIDVESEVGKGSTFTVYLPIQKSYPDTNDEVVNGHHEPLAPPRSLDHPMVEEDLDEEGLETAKPLILIVEDNPELRGFLRDALQYSYRVIESANGQEGLLRATGYVPDLIVCDIIIDGIDGVELCRKLKSDVRTCHIPIVLLTAKHTEESIRSSHEVGADDYIVKPFSVKLLNSRIRNLIEQRAMLRDLFGKVNSHDFKGMVTSSIDSQFLEKLNGAIERKIDEPNLTPAMLASELCMSRMQLYRKVSALTNRTVNCYIRFLRMNRAAELLANSDMQVAEVAYRVGFSEPSNFTKTFSKQFNQTPSQFALAKRNRKTPFHPTPSLTA